jgi:hypothetical protein
VTSVGIPLLAFPAFPACPLFPLVRCSPISIITKYAPKHWLIFPDNENISHKTYLHTIA